MAKSKNCVWGINLQTRTHINIYIFLNYCTLWHSSACQKYSLKTAHHIATLQLKLLQWTPAIKNTDTTNKPSPQQSNSAGPKFLFTQCFISSAKIWHNKAPIQQSNSIGPSEPVIMRFHCIVQMNFSYYKIVCFVCFSSKSL